LLNRDGYRILFSLSPVSRRFACYLLAFYDLRRYQIIEMKRDKVPVFAYSGRSIKGKPPGPRRQAANVARIIHTNVTLLVDAGFLEYGFEARSLYTHGTKHLPTVRLVQKLLAAPEDIQGQTWNMEARRERQELLKQGAIVFNREEFDGVSLDAEEGNDPQED
jgi:hypothetical protein